MSNEQGGEVLFHKEGSQDADDGAAETEQGGNQRANQSQAGRQAYGDRQEDEQVLAPFLLGLLHFHFLLGRLGSLPEPFGHLGIAVAERAFHHASEAVIFQRCAAVGAGKGL